MKKNNIDEWDQSIDRLATNNQVDGDHYNIYMQIN